MKINRRSAEDVEVLEISGKVMGGSDLDLFRNAIKEIVDAGKLKLIIDMAGVKFINSSGLGILISGFISLKNRGGELKLIKILDDKVKTPLRLTKLLDIIDYHDTEEEALASF
jgi:anti-sigma B factor antagonist